LRRGTSVDAMAWLDQSLSCLVPHAAAKVDTELVEVSCELVKKEVRSKTVNCRTKSNSLCEEVDETVEMARWGCIYGRLAGYIACTMKLQMPHRPSIMEIAGKCFDDVGLSHACRFMLLRLNLVIKILSSKPSMLQIRHHGGGSFDFGMHANQA
jgi:hypothetical protein